MNEGMKTTAEIIAECHLPFGHDCQRMVAKSDVQWRPAKNSVSLKMVKEALDEEFPAKWCDDIESWRKRVYARLVKEAKG